MRDEFSGQRGSDIPDAGYSSRRQKETSDAIMFFLRHLERNRILLLHIVVKGQDEFVKITSRIWRGLLVDKELLQRTYDWLKEQAGFDPEGQLLALQLMQGTQRRQSWDFRKVTAEQLRNQRRKIMAELRREQAKPRITYSRH